MLKVNMKIREGMLACKPFQAYPTPLTSTNPANI